MGMSSKRNKKGKRKSKRVKTGNKSLISEIWLFMKENKAWWLAPIIIMIILLGVLIILGQSSAVSPFIYALI